MLRLNFDRLEEIEGNYRALTERHEEPVERGVGVDPAEDDDGGEVADHAEEADDEQRHALDPELHAAHEALVLLEALVALVRRGRRHGAPVGASAGTAAAVGIVNLFGRGRI